MSFYLVKSKNGTYSPLDESDFENSKVVGVGTVVKCTAPRNYKFLKKFFALLNLGFQAQEKYKSFEVYRKIIIIRAGFYELILNTHDLYEFFRYRNRNDALYLLLPREVVLVFP